MIECLGLKDCFGEVELLLIKESVNMNTRSFKSMRSAVFYARSQLLTFAKTKMQFRGDCVGELKQQPFTVFVEGNVGAGKTSFLNYFKSFDEFLVLEEPVEKWKDFHGFNLLDLKFNEPERFQFPFQTYATLTRLKQHLELTEKPFKMMERSLLTARQCFVENLRETCCMTECITC